MDNALLLASLRATVRVVPSVLPHLSTRTRYALAEPTEYKSYEFFYSAIVGLVEGVYQGLIGGIFIDTLANLISGQLTDAYQRAWADEGNFGDLPPYLLVSLEDAILSQYEHVDQFYRDIVDARVDGTPIEPLLNRAQMWANRWREAYNEALRLITLENGGKMEWIEGDTIQKCETCVALDGIVMYAKEWEALGVHPQGAPNDALICGGWHCDCRLSPTEKRRTPKGFDTVLNIVTLAGMA
jgi:hypothetical protein